MVGCGLACPGGGVPGCRGASSGGRGASSGGRGGGGTVGARIRGLGVSGRYGGGGGDSNTEHGTIYAISPSPHNAVSENVLKPGSQLPYSRVKALNQQGGRQNNNVPVTYLHNYYAAKRNKHKLFRRFMRNFRAPPAPRSLTCAQVHTNQRTTIETVDATSHFRVYSR